MALRVLLLDDDVEVLEIVAQELRREGCDLEEVDDRERALERLREGPAPDVAVVDCSVGSGDGGALVDRLRASSPHVPVIYLSGDGIVLSRLRSAEDSFVLQKPFAIEELVSLLRAAVPGAPLHAW